MPHKQGRCFSLPLTAHLEGVDELDEASLVLLAPVSLLGLRLGHCPSSPHQYRFNCLQTYYNEHPNTRGNGKCKWAAFWERAGTTSRWQESAKVVRDTLHLLNLFKAKHMVHKFLTSLAVVCEDLLLQLACAHHCIYKVHGMTYSAHSEVIFQTWVSWSHEKVKL